MAEQDPEFDAAMATPTGQAFQRLLTDPQFAGQVADNPEAALAEYSLDTDDAEAILSDAEALEGEVAGFASRTSTRDLTSRLGGMHTPTRLTLNTTSLNSWAMSFSFF